MTSFISGTTLTLPFSSSGGSKMMPRGVDVALVDVGVDDDAGRSPLPRHRILAARIEVGIRPIPWSTFLKFSIWSGRSPAAGLP